MFVFVLVACLTTHKCTADHYKLKMERRDRIAAEAAVKAEAKARKREQQLVADFATAATQNLEDTNATLAHRDRIIASLRSGRLSFPACPVPEAAADSAATESRAESGQPGLVGEAITERLAVCDEVVHERNMAVELLKLERK